MENLEKSLKNNVHEAQKWWDNPNTQALLKDLHNNSIVYNQYMINNAHDKDKYGMVVRYAGKFDEVKQIYDFIMSFFGEE